jgi:hypothetical protein
MRLLLIKVSYDDKLAKCTATGNLDIPDYLTKLLGSPKTCGVKYDCFYLNLTFDIMKAMKLLGAKLSRFSILLSAILLMHSTLFAQNDRRHWFFGNYAGLDFSSGFPISVPGPINTNEGCTVMNDATGAVLFSTDGVNVYNRLGTTMPGYTTLWGDPSTTQSALVIPEPGNDSIYDIFAGAAEVAFSRHRFTGVSYSRVNMRLSSGNGAVISSNDTLLPYTCEKICGIMESKRNRLLGHRTQICQ